MSSQSSKKRKHVEEVDEEVSGDDKDLKHKKEADEDSGEESEDSEEDSDYLESDDNEDKEFIDKVVKESFGFRLQFVWFVSKQIQIDFSAYPPIDEDFNGVKCLLSQLWLKEKINVSELTQLLIDQKHICSILKVNAHCFDQTV